LAFAFNLQIAADCLIGSQPGHNPMVSGNQQLEILEHQRDGAQSGCGICKSALRSQDFVVETSVDTRQAEHLALSPIAE